MAVKLRDKKFFDIHGGLDTRAEFDKDNKSILYLEGAKNIDIKGKNIRRAKGQTEKLQIAGESISYIGSQEISGIDYMRCITDADKYYRIDGSWNETEANSWGAASEEYGLYASKFYSFGDADTRYGLQFSSDRSKFFIFNDTNNNLEEWGLSTIGDVSTASLTTTYNFFNTESATMRVFTFSRNGSHFYITDGTTIYQYDLSAPFDLSTESYIGSIAISNSTTGGMTISNNGKHIYIESNARQRQITMSTAYDITTASSVYVTDNDSDTNNMNQMFISPDGTFLLAPTVTGHESPDNVIKFPLSAAYDLSTIGYDSAPLEKIDVETYGNEPTAVDSNADVSIMWVYSSADNAVYQYNTPGFSTSEGSIHMFQFHEDLVSITGKSDPFIDDGTIISQTGFLDQWGVYGSIGITFTNRTFIADGRTIYWTEANTADQWNANYYKQFDSDIVDLKLFGSYLMIWTKSKVWYLSGTSESDFSFQEWGTRGVFTKFANCEFDNNIYTFINNGLFPIETTGDMAQTRFVQSLTYKVANLLEEVDPDRLDEVIVVPYENRKQIWVYVPVSGNATIYKAYVLNFINKIEERDPIAIYTREGNAITCAAQFKGNIYSGTSDGKIYQEDSGDNFDGNIIECDMKFTEMSFGNSKAKRLRDFMLWLNPNSDNKFTFYYILNGDTVNKKTVDLDLSAKQSDNKDRISRYIPIRPDQFTNIQIGISTDALDEDFELLGFEFLGLLLSNSINQI